MTSRWSETKENLNCDTYHVDDLHEREAEGELQRIALVDHRPLQHVVMVQQVVQQPLLMEAPASS